ncbi:hypothetical protein GCM10027294_53090 [Marinactinospora endophytica]
MTSPHPPEGSLEEFVLDERTLREDFDAVIRDRVFKDAVPAGQDPVLVLLGGQLAAGKSRSITRITRRHPHIVEINPDSFRPLHRQYERIMRERPHDMVRATAQAMHAWAGMCREYAFQHGYSLLIEGTFSSPEGPLKFAAQAPQGYTTEVVVVATPQARSRLDMLGRYLDDPPGKGRWNSVEAHDVGYANLPRTLAALENSPDVGRVIVTDRSGVHHYDNARRDDGTWAVQPGAVEVLHRVRGDGAVPFQEREAQKWLGAYWKRSEMLIRREELTAVTAPSMRELHGDADRIAPVAYERAPHELARHARWQKVQLAVVEAGERGVPNKVLPASPRKYFEASPQERAAFTAALQASGPDSALGGAVVSSPRPPVAPSMDDAIRATSSTGGVKKSPPPSMEQPRPGHAHTEQPRPRHGPG